MGKMVLIAVIVIASIIALSLITVHERSDKLPETLELNFKNLGSYALQYAINQVVDEEVTQTMSQEFTGDSEFLVLNGQINRIEYNFTYKDVTVGNEDYIPDDSNGSVDFSGSLNINPNNGMNEFSVVTPSGIFDRWDLHSYNIEGYSGPASKIEIKPKAKGIYLTINDENVALSKQILYSITSENMTVNIHNDRVKWGRAMGKWWIDINATDADIDPMPEGVEFQDNGDGNTIETQIYSLIQTVEINAEVSSFVSGRVYDHTSSVLLEADTKVDFDILEDGSVVVNDEVKITFTALGAAFANSNNNVSMEYSLNGGDDYTSLWNNNYIENGWEFEIEDIEPGTEIVLNAKWYDLYYRRYGSQTSISSWTDVYRDEDQAPSYVPYSGQQAAEEFMAPYLTESGEVTLGENDAIFLFELGHHTKDYQDAVMLVTFEKSANLETVYVGDIDLETDNFKVIYWKP